MEAARQASPPPSRDEHHDVLRISLRALSPAKLSPLRSPKPGHLLRSEPLSHLSSCARTCGPRMGLTVEVGVAQTASVVVMLTWPPTRSRCASHVAEDTRSSSPVSWVPMWRRSHRADSPPGQRRARPAQRRSEMRKRRQTMAGSALGRGHDHVRNCSELGTNRRSSWQKHVRE